MLIVLSAGLYASCSPEGNPEEEIAQPQTMKSIEEPTAFIPNADWPLYQHRVTPVSYPPLSFLGPDMQPVWLEAFEGKFVVLNFWATWCGPCKEEMPSLDRLQAAFSADDVVVIALSNDRTGPDAVLPFFRQIEVSNLQPYYEENLGVSRIMSVKGYPTTVIFNRDGQEVGRVIKPAEWDGPEAVALIKELVAP